MLVLLLGASAVHAATLQVGPTRPFTTVGSAVGSAQPGDVIEVDAGTYIGAIDLRDDVTVHGAGAGLTILTAGTDQNVVRVRDGARATLSGLTIRAGQRGVFVEASTVALRDVEVLSNSGPADGGGLRADGGSSVVVDSCVFSRNAARGRGGQIYTVDADLVVTDSRFETGSAGAGGGGVFVDGGSARFDRSVFVENTATGNGGGLALDGGATVDVVDSVLAANAASRGGGAWVGEGALSLVDAQILGDRATGEGAGVAVDGVVSSVTSTRTVIAQHVSQGPGAGVALLDHGRWDGVSDAFLRNSVGVDGLGGGFYLADTASATLAGALFQGNAAKRGGGLYSATRGAVWIDGAMFSGNAAVERGGGVAATGSGNATVAISGSTFVANRATGTAAIGGGAWLARQATVLRRDRFFDNQAAGSGGGAGFEGLTASDVGGNAWCGNTAIRGGAVNVVGVGLGAWSSDAFWDNRATAQGGAIYADGVDLAVRFATFTGDSAADGGAIYLRDAGIDARHVVIANSSSGNGVSGSGTGKAYVFANGALFANSLDDFGGALAGFAVPNGTITADPQFTAYSNDGDCWNDALWPAVGSPLIDAGDPAVHDPDGSRADIGAFGGPTADPAWFDDADGDGVQAIQDCDDHDKSVSAATVFYGDGDGDGFAGTTVTALACAQPPGYAVAADDCDDGDASVHPGAVESCSGSVDANCDGSAGSADQDGDSVSACKDCDDGDSTIYPGAPETCDGVDENCDGLIDNGVTIGVTEYWSDADGDGYGDVTVMTTACTAPPGYVPRAGDCDDADAVAHPGAVESCTGTVDRNCDGFAGDEDGDGDGYIGCEDCDDTDETVFPGAADVCNGVDGDCDGTIDEDGATLGVVAYPDADGDGYGDASAAWHGCEAPAEMIADGTDCDDGNAGVHPGVDEIGGDGIDQDCDGYDPAAVDTDTSPPGCGCNGVPGTGFLGVLVALGAISRRRGSRDRRS